MRRDGGRGSLLTFRRLRGRLRAALMPLFGADAVVWTGDVADLPVTDAVEVLVWMARTLVAAVLHESRMGGPEAATS